MANLYPYQERVYNALMAGKNVIVQAPTGAGKTRAALFPFFENLSRFSEDSYQPNAPLPLTCRYAVPMRVLASQFEREYREYFDKLDQKRGTALRGRYVEKLDVMLPAIQTGETPEDAEFASPLTFCTIDQCLASFIGTPFSVSPRAANTNVGAVAGSYLILDEFHLFPLDKGRGARTTAVAMLRLLDGLCRFVLMTATFSNELVYRLGQVLNADVVRVTNDELHNLMQGRSRMVQLSGEPMTPEAILAAHVQARERGAGASLVICNTVTRAQDIYMRLRDVVKQTGAPGTIGLELLHSRFTSEDRKEKSDRLEAWLGKGAWTEDGRFAGVDSIVVATQVVEVGLNISAGVLHTEVAPANSIVQRAGRCARFPNQVGEVVVYPIAGDASRRGRYRPYDDDRCVATCDHLREMIETSGAQRLPFGYAEEQNLIDAVHTDEDRRMLDRFIEHEQQIERLVMETLRTHEYGNATELIRNVMSVSVLIHDEPEQAITTKPFTWQSFQLHPSTLHGAWEQMQELRAGAWVLKQLIPGGDASGKEEDDNSREPVYTWDRVRDRSEIGRALRLALPPDLAAYDKELGFRLLLNGEPNSGRWMSAPVNGADRKKRGWGQNPGKQRSYLEHIKGLMGAYDWNVRRELAWVSARLERELGLQPGSVDEAVRLAIACHDIGKLATDWQHWAQEWQALLVRVKGPQYTVQPGRELLAKTDRLRDWKEERELQKTLPAKRPNHACAGAVASALLIGQRFTAGVSKEQRKASLLLTQAVVSAIARHHSPTAEDYDRVAWERDSVSGAIAEALEACRLAADLQGPDLTPRAAGKVPADWLVTPSADSTYRRLGTWLGFVIVRALRLCDQRADWDW